MSLLQLLSIPLFQRALIGAFLAGGTLSLLGTVVVTLNLTTIRFAMMHLALLGAAIAMAFNLPILSGALGGIILSALMLGPWSERWRIETGVMGAFLMTGSLGLAFLLFYKAGIPAMEAFALFTGSLLTIGRADLAALAILGFIIAFMYWAFFYEIQLVLYDRDLAQGLGVPVHLIQTGLIFLTGLGIGLSIRVVGALLVDAIILLPALSGLALARSLKQGLIFTSVFGIMSSVGGFFLSLLADFPIGASITVLGVLILAVVSLIQQGKINPITHNQS